MRRNPNPLALDAQLCFDLYSTSLAMTQVYKPLLEPLGLTYTQYLVLLVLLEKNGLGLKELADRLFQKPGALTPVVKRLEKDELLSRIRSKEDERYMQITLTAKGEALKPKLEKVNQCIFDNCGLPESELVRLSEQLKSLRVRLHNR